MSPRRLLLTPIVCFSLLFAACGAPTPEPTPEPPTATATASATATPTPTPTASPTITPTPTKTATPKPTARPEGFFVHPKQGFAFTTPEEWVRYDADDNLVIFDSQRDALRLMVGRYGASEDGQSQLDLLIADLRQALGQDVAGLAETDRGERPLGATLTAEYAHYVGTLRADPSVEYAFTAFSAVAGPFEYLLWITAPEQSFIARESTLDTLLGGFQANAFVFGLDRQETIVRLGYEPRDPEDLDPALGSGSADGYKALLFAGLVRLTPELAIAPDLAESWDVSADGLVYTFVLRGDARFADGRPITADDVRASWERVADPATKSSGAATYLGDIEGVQAKLDGEADTIAGIDVIDGRTLQVTLDGPKAYFLAKLTYPVTFVVDPRDPNKGDRWMFEANASGPYQLDRILADEAVVFERNPNYHTAAPTRYLAYVVNPGGSGISLFEAGEIDVTGLASEDALRIRGDVTDPLHDLLRTVPSMCTTYLQIDPARAPFDDPDIRRAFALAVDRDGLVERLTSNTDLAATTILPPAMPGFSADHTAYTYDPEGARAALEASTYAGKTLPTITLTVGGYGGDPGDYVNALISTWRDALGVTVRVEQLDPVAFPRLTREGERNGQILAGGWCADYPDPENFLDALFYPGKEYNYAALDNATLNGLLESARVEADPAARLRLYAEAEQLILEEGLAIPVMHGVADILVSPRLEGYPVVPLGVRTSDLVTIRTR